LAMVGCPWAHPRRIMTAFFHGMLLVWGVYA
jgi:hypothetical protein